MLETQLAVSAGDDRIRLHALNHCTNEGFQSKRIGDQPYITITPHSGKCQLLWQRAADVVFGEQAEWQLIAIGLAVCSHFYFAEQHRVRLIAETHRIRDIDLLYVLALACEPAAFWQVNSQ